MRDSGYKDAAHAIAEIIDNSIQAGLKTEKHIDVELICLEEETLIKKRSSKRIKEIAVYDNGCGMDAETLEMSLAFAQGTNLDTQVGMGKFGMGLPNSSVSQCQRVDVWTWREGRIHHSYLDIQDIIDGIDEVPVPVEVNSIPEKWKSRIKSEIQEHGTLVIWSRLDRMKWGRSRAFFANTRAIVGRMYRYFLHDEKCSIRLAACLESGGKESCTEEYCRPNDPLYLMTNTQAPKSVKVGDEVFDYENKSQFVQYGDTKTLKVSWRGVEHEVTIKASEGREDFRRACAALNISPGDTVLGKHAAKNQGVSVLRAGRELELNRSFENSYDPTERWWGIEVGFGPQLDEVFGVTNNKQSATAFSNLSLSDIARDEEVDPAELESEMDSEDDPRLPIIRICDEIRRLLSGMRTSLKAQTEGVKKAKKAKDQDRAASAASKTSSQDGEKGGSDQKAAKLTDAQKKKELENEINMDDPDSAEEDKEMILNEWLEGEKYIFNSALIRASNVIFDVSTPAGKIKVTINKSHPAYSAFIEELEEKSGIGFDCLKLIFASWARLEDTLGSTDEDRKHYENLRMKWGKGVSDMIEAYQGNLK